MKLRLFNYWRSSASHRVRIGLGIKGLAFEYIAVNIVKKEQFSTDYRDRNWIGQVPTLELTEDDGRVLSFTQSLPILEYLDERFPENPLLPRDAVMRAKSRALAEIVNSGIQPHQNLSTAARLTELKVDPKAYAAGFIAAGLVAYAKLAAEVAGTFSVGDAPTLADIALVPQINAARRFGVLDDNKFAWSPLMEHATAVEKLVEIEQRCMELPAFANAAPDNQPDAVK
ncbi:maleylacetoacetate isomerase [soil metagenome]